MSIKSAKKILTASVFSVLALGAATSIDTFGMKTPFVASASAQDAAYPIIVNEQQFKELVDKGAKIVDSRQPAAYEKGHIPGAVSLPWAKLNVSERDGIRN